MISISVGGVTLGLVISNCLSGWICSSYAIGGWPTSFYTYSILGVIWVIIWVTLIYETPNEDLCISKKEVEYINRGVTQSHQKNVPWRAILMSPPVWAIVISDTMFEFAWNLVLLEIPMFLSTIFECDVLTAGGLTSAPLAARFITCLLTAVAADYIIQREYLSILKTRKLFAIIDLGVSAACFFIMSYVGHSLVASVVLLIISFSALGFNTSSVDTNPADISPNYAGIIAGLMMSISSCTGFVVPIITGLLLEEHNTFKEWSVLFQLTAGIELFGLVFYLIFAKGEEQEWSKTEAIEETENLVIKE
ncbi:sialin-like [Antedon mediterranea]|uniref:sialin-like n=1 Tax=Antedon mediterranea TaxID=105859 RepID=UPI003AF9C15C